ncbi:MAG TPA: hypothetical protein VKR21_07455 [Solirubrobacteraceae bacterium]|nr:hypothetical protein [Solirubrobacteraceae bacterium]
MARRISTARARLLATLIVASVTFVLIPAQAQAFQLGLEDTGFESPTASTAQIQRADDALQTTDASVIRVAVYWARIAPTRQTPGFNPSDPNDPNYNWSSLDYAVRTAANHHKQLLAVIWDAPTWAEGPGTPGPGVSPGSWNPDLTEYTAFLHALAVRYSGSFDGLPQIESWEVWDEPNLPYWFSAPDPVSAYRTLLNRAYGVLKAVRKDNQVVFGGLAPVKPNPESFTPLDFAAAVLCLQRVGAQFRADPSCHQRVNFDVFGFHSYTLGATPTKHAAISGDVFVADMGKVRNLVRAVDRRDGVNRPIWVTEFAWFTDPPNSQLGDPDPTAARYVAYAMYEMWRSGVSLVLWQGLTDTPPSAGDTGRGLYTSTGEPKLMLRAFAFPVIARVRHGHGLVWGRAPVSSRVRVAVQRALGSRWRTIATVKTASDGVFSLHFKAHHNGLYRARVIGGPTSLAYDSTPIPPKYTLNVNFG